MFSDSVRIFRLHRRIRAADNFDGSLQYANRWNFKGTPMLYASTHLSLCCLEMLVHVAPQTMPPSLVWSYADLRSPVPELGYSWDLQEESLTRQAGRRWVQEGSSVATLVPSVVLPQEWNVLLNPLHAEYNRIAWGGTEPLHWDRRLVQLAMGKPIAEP